MSLLAELRAVVGDAHLLVDPDLRASHEVDWTGRFRGTARAIARPGSTSEVAAVLSACSAAEAPVVVQGGNTGLVGGGVPDDGEVVLHTGRLDRLGPVDPATRTVLVGAGATLADVQAHVRAAGLDLGVDLASRDAATIGGMVATDAGGTRVVAHGPMRDQVVGLEAVLADGRVLSSWHGGLAKDTAGYALPHLLVGSEGTLAVVTQVLLRLVAPPTGRAVVVVGTTSVTAAVDLVAALRTAAGPSLAACELVLRAGVDLVVDVAGVVDPVPGAAALLVVQLAGDVAPDQLVDRCADLVDAPGVVDVVVGLDPIDQRRLWEVRERHTEAVATLGIPHKLDVAVPLGRLPELLDRVGPTVAALDPDAVVHVWGHVAEGNLHVNVLGPPAEEDAVDGAVLRLVGELGGTVSAEHGIGRAKVEHLGLTRDAVSIEAMRAIKQALDPGWLLGRGVLLHPPP